jgi:FecR protein
MNKTSAARTLCTLGGVLFALFSSLATAQVRDEYGEIRQTVARISFLSGEVSFSRGDDPDDWQPADRNVPMTLGDRIYTGNRSRLELQIQGGDFVRLGANTDFAALDLTEEARQFSLTSGVASIRIRRLSQYEIFEIDTPNAAVTFEEPGDYRVDVDEDGFTRIAVRGGSATVAAGGGQIRLVAGEGMEIDGIDAPRYDILELSRPDGWDRWVSQREDLRTRTRSYQYINADIVGGDDLDEYGRWEQVRDYGWVWSPTDVTADWAPYRSGHWIWQDPWGWTWVSAEPWGWAPYHYGRWTRIASRWCWVPDAPAVRYVSYSPALVAFVGGGPGWSASISVGSGGFVGWFPLGPRDPFSPWWGGRSRTGYSSVSTNVTYVNRTYVTVVNRNVFVSGSTVSGNVVSDRTVVSQVASAPVLRGPIPVVPTRDSLHVAVRPDAIAAPRPPAQIESRMVVARTAPPPAPPTFQAKLAAITENRGAPIAPADAARISVEKRGRQAVPDVRPVAAQPGRVTLSPRDAGSAKAEERRAEPVTAFRGRPLVKSEKPVPARPVAPASPSEAPPAVEDVPPRQPVSPAPPVRQLEPDRGRERRVVTVPPESPSIQPPERVRPEVPPTPAAPPPSLERRRAASPPETPVPLPPEVERQRQPRPAELPPGLQRRHEPPTAVPAPPQPNLERRRERPTPAPEQPQAGEVKPEVRRGVAPRFSTPAEPQGEARQPVQRGRTVTPKPKGPKDKDTDKHKTDKRETTPD